MEWVSVKTSLPDLKHIETGHFITDISSDDVLVFNGRISVGKRFIRNGEEHFCSYDEENMGGITHWMPLPKPPPGPFS